LAVLTALSMCAGGPRCQFARLGVAAVVRALLRESGQSELWRVAAGLGPLGTARSASRPAPGYEGGQDASDPRFALLKTVFTSSRASHRE